MYYNGNSFYDFIISIYYDIEIDLLLVWHSNLAKTCVQHHMIVTTYAVWLVSYKSFLPPARGIIIEMRTLCVKYLDDHSFKYYFPEE